MEDNQSFNTAFGYYSKELFGSDNDTVISHLDVEYRGHKIH